MKQNLKRRSRHWMLDARCWMLVATGCWMLSCNDSNKLPETVTFTEHIAPVLYKNCTVCHRPEGSGHFNLVSFSDAKKYGPSIAYVTKERLMPPWPADPHYSRFVGERVLEEKDIELIAKWVATGMAEGPADKLPALPGFFNGSFIGKPDLVLDVEPYHMDANSTDHFLLVKVPYELGSDTFAAAIEFVPGPANIVHHVNGDMVRYEFDKKKNVFEGVKQLDMVEDSTILAAFQRMGLPNDDGSYPTLQKSVVNYLPGVFSLKYPEGIGGYKLSRKGAFLLNDMHYGFTKKEAWDSSHINVFFAKTPPKRPAKEFQLGTLGVSPVEPDLIIDANTVKKVHSKYTIPEDISILTINPHMHLIGKSFKAYAVKPEGDTIPLISIPRWDFNWQYFYTFKKMVKVPAGSTIIAEGVYDNTKQNLNNPFSPPQLVRDRNGSMKATDEMFQFIVTYLPYQEGDEDVSLETTSQTP